MPGGGKLDDERRELPGDGETSLYDISWRQTNQISVIRFVFDYPARARADGTDMSRSFIEGDVRSSLPSGREPRHQGQVALERRVSGRGRRTFNAGPGRRRHLLLHARVWCVEFRQLDLFGHVGRGRQGKLWFSLLYTVKVSNSKKLFSREKKGHRVLISISVHLKIVTVLIFAVLHVNKVIFLRNISGNLPKNKQLNE